MWNIVRASEHGCATRLLLNHMAGAPTYEGGGCFGEMALLIRTELKKTKESLDNVGEAANRCARISENVQTANGVTHTGPEVHRGSAHLVGWNWSQKEVLRPCVRSATYSIRGHAPNILASSQPRPSCTLLYRDRSAMFSQYSFGAS